MNKPVTVTTERVDDIPLLLAQLQRMGVQELLDEHFPTHGNWQGLSLGNTAIVWLSHILSQADHRLNHVQPWFEHHLETVGVSLDQDLRALDVTDDRLESVLRYLSQDRPWRNFEQALSQRQIQVYDLKVEQVRLDSTSISGFWSQDEEGLFQRGHSKDHRPDLLQLKLILATLDPLGLAIASEIVPGNAADDPLYEPAVGQVRQTLARNGLLYVGDCKMSSIQTRHFIHAGGDYYLCPLPKTQVSAEEMELYLSRVREEKVELEEVKYDYANGETVLIATGFEQSYDCQLQDQEKECSWEERRLIVYSFAHANAQKKALQARLEKAQKELALLNQTRRGKKPFPDRESFAQAAEKILSQHRVESLFELSFQETVEQRHQRRYRDRPARTLEKRHFQVEYHLDTTAVERQMKSLGWRVYATNHPKPTLSLSQAVTVYRQEYLIEQGFGRLKGQPLSVRPMFLQREDHIKGLIRLLAIALRLLTLVEFQVRRVLALEKKKLPGLYASNPKRSTARPTAEKLLASFKEITLVLIEARGETYADLTVLNPLQRQILQLLNLPIEIYTRLGPQSDNPP